MRIVAQWIADALAPLAIMFAHPNPATMVCVVQVIFDSELPYPRQTQFPRKSASHLMLEILAISPGHAEPPDQDWWPSPDAFENRSTEYQLIATLAAYSIRPDEA